MKTVDEYMSELHKGNKIRITYNRMIDDCLGGGWSEELWSYDNANTGKKYVCEYPISTYKNDFHTMHTRKHTMDNIQSAINDLLDGFYDEYDVVAIKIAVE